jgi:diguanylate cyclase (GGDEF)-like protein
MSRPTAMPPHDFERLTNDRLTGALGYHYLRLRLDEELDRAARYSRPLSLVLVDLDDLRGINDRFGRPAGDFVLAQVASALMSGARMVDRVGRWAGGAFAMVLPETGGGAAYGLAERLRADLAARRFGGANLAGARPLAGLRITVSCGVAGALPDGRGLVARCHEALNRAKMRGRNRSILDG